MADRDVAYERAQGVLVEYLRHQALIADRHDAAAALGSGDARGFLTAVLERKQRKVSKPRDIVLGGVDPENPALVAWPVAMIVHRRHAEASIQG
jgi:hypothetical protein